MLNARRPQFFKVFLPDSSSNRLSIPLGFLKHISSETLGSVFLTGPSGNTWQVDLIQDNEGLFFHQGWPEFVKDHSAEYGDFFVFKYAGNFHFTVTIFDKSACEKETAFLAKCSQGASNFGENNGKKRVRVQEAASSYRTFEGELQQRSMNSVSKATPKKNVILSRRKEEDSDQSVKKLGLHGVCRLSMLAGDDVQITSEVLATNNPFFASCVKQSNVQPSRLMYFPSSFAKKHCVSYRRKEKIILRNSGGNQWTVNFVRNSRCGAAAFCAGWSSFARDNNIKEGDTCVFELVGEFEMLVHISRKNR